MQELWCCLENLSQEWMRLVVKDLRLEKMNDVFKERVVVFVLMLHHEV